MNITDTLRPNPISEERLFYWHRESSNSNAEVDYVIQNQDDIIPIEVKSSGKGLMQSMFQFLKQKYRSKGIRFSLENFSKLEQIVLMPISGLRIFF